MVLNIQIVGDEAIGADEYSLKKTTDTDIWGSGHEWTKPIPGCDMINDKLMCSDVLFPSTAVGRFVVKISRVSGCNKGRINGGTFS